MILANGYTIQIPVIGQWLAVHRTDVKNIFEQSEMICTVPDLKIFYSGGTGGSVG